jgi:uncharacterized SAM-binding protein YcdF (DUF218 family)
VRLDVVLQTVAFSALVFTNYVRIPSSNTQQTHFDTIIVLGTPTRDDGTPSAELRERVLEGVREYKAGVSTHIIMTGAAAHNKFVEAHAMKVLAVEKGVPGDAVIEEDQAKDTIQNIYFSHEIMLKRGWHSAEVVSSPSHLPRTALILQHYDFTWRTHAALWPAEYDREHIARLYRGEAKGCWTLTHDGFRANRWLPGS